MIDRADIHVFAGELLEWCEEESDGVADVMDHPEINGERVVSLALDSLTQRRRCNQLLSLLPPSVVQQIEAEWSAADDHPAGLEALEDVASDELRDAAERFGVGEYLPPGQLPDVATWWWMDSEFPDIAPGGVELVEVRVSSYDELLWIGGRHVSDFKGEGRQFARAILPPVPRLTSCHPEIGS